jgi:hypothetical protein
LSWLEDVKNDLQEFKVKERKWQIKQKNGHQWAPIWGQARNQS